MSHVASILSHSQAVQSIPQTNLLSAAPRLPAGPEPSCQASDVASLSDTGDATPQVAAQPVAQPVSGFDVRAEKVAALQQAIAGGTYNVSAADVADKLITHLLGGR